MSPGRRPERDLDLTRLGSALLAGAAWMLFGAATHAHVSSLVHWRTILVAILSLTALRIVPVALSLAGSGLRRPTVLFVGWFGPRGLPSVVFALIASEELARHPGARTSSPRSQRRSCSASSPTD
ncbi:cation:proton antiporter [Aeromicrobium sp. UC242_57]|uniref:cation:proton antiporter domain-containing protein n=1 Tax=Aeromicrobium sp. UC242_57 TaxID=3374624 RepID=UPI0037B210CB